MTKRSTVSEAEFGEFASAQAGQLFRIAYLMCGNWHEAEDLVQTALAKLFVAWARVRTSRQRRLVRPVGAGERLPVQPKAPQVR